VDPVTAAGETAAIRKKMKESEVLRDMKLTPIAPVYTSAVSAVLIFHAGAMRQSRLAG
jgi:hypothetical protein